MAVQWQWRDKDLDVQTKPGCAQHHHILQSCVKKKKKAVMLEELFSFVFLMNESD